MGRHSLPGPEDRGSQEPADERPDEQQTQRFGFGGFDSTDRDFGSDDHPADLGHENEAPDRDPASAPAPVPPRPTGAQREWEDGEWTGSHRAVTPGRRKVSIGVIVALVSVVVVVGAVILWRFFGDTLSNRSDVAAARCVEGDVKVSVITDPAIAEPVAALAERYNSTADPVGDRCVKISVGHADSDRVVNGFT